MGTFLNPEHQSVTPKELFDLPLMLSNEKDFINLIIKEKPKTDTQTSKTPHPETVRNEKENDKDSIKTSSSPAESTEKPLNNPVSSENKEVASPSVEPTDSKEQKPLPQKKDISTPASLPSEERELKTAVNGSNNPLKKTATGDFDVLISALEGLSEKSAKKKSSKTSLYQDKINAILHEHDREQPQSNISIRPPALETSEAFKQSLANIKETLSSSRIDLNTIQDVAAYLHNLKKAEKSLMPHNNGVLKTPSSVEAIYDIVKSMNGSTRTQEDSNRPSDKGAVPDEGETVKDESGQEIIKESPSIKDDESQPSVSLNAGDLNDNTALKDTYEDEDAKKIENDFIKKQDGLLNLPTDFENLSIDEKLSIAQEQSAAQLQVFNAKFGDQKEKTRDSNRTATLLDLENFSSDNDSLKQDESAEHLKDRLDNMLMENDQDEESSFSEMADDHAKTSESLPVATSDAPYDNLTEEQVSSAIESKAAGPDCAIEPLPEPVSLDCALEEALSSKTVPSFSDKDVKEDDDKEFSEALSLAVKRALNHEYGDNVNMASLQVQKDSTEVLEDTTKASINAIVSLNEMLDDSIDGDENDDGDESEEHTPVSVTVSKDSYDTDSHQDIYEKTSLVDGNPATLSPSTLKIMEDYEQYENRKLGRPLESRDYYEEVMRNDEWFNTVVNSGYNDGPVFAALCYSRRDVDQKDRYNWTLTVFKDFELIVSSPEFHHNLRTRFSFYMKHPIELTLKISDSVPNGCPEDLARRALIGQVEKEKSEFKKNKRLMNFFRNLGEDIDTMNITIYTQEKS